MKQVKMPDGLNGFAISCFIKKHKRKLLVFAVLLLLLCRYEYRDFYQSPNGITITVWPGVFGQGKYFVYPYKYLGLWRVKEDLIVIDTKSEFLELRFVNQNQIAIYTPYKKHIEFYSKRYSIKDSVFSRDMEIVNNSIWEGYTTNDVYPLYDTTYSLSSCVSAFCWYNIYEYPYVYCKDSQQYELPNHNK